MDYRPAPDRAHHEVFHALGNRTRLRILRALQDGDLSVSDIVAATQLPQSLVSHHLALLRRAGLVVARRAGQFRLYALAPARTPFRRRLLQCLRHCFQHLPETAASGA
jgi:ArsR family transcriptional regulator, arsenate/arsenite/antimonite-responsive transcriptional repressor